MSYVPWLAIAADLYIPLLAVIYAKRLPVRHRISPSALAGMLFVNLGIAWGMMVADRIWNIWPAWRLDYSTHTAVSLAFLVGLCVSAPRQTPVWAFSLAVYAVLMMGLDYHSMADIVSSAAVAAAAMGMASLSFFRSTASNGSAAR